MPKQNSSQLFLTAEDLGRDVFGSSTKAVLTKRSKNPASVPPPFQIRPLRWRRETVVAWIADREEKEKAKQLSQARLTRK